MSLIWAALLPPVLLWGLNRVLRRSLAATRERETAEPVGLPWRQVDIPTANNKRLFGWWIPARSGAPALVVMHGWGGNAQMMLPLAQPLNAAGYSLLFVDARCHGQSDDDSFASLPRFAEDIEHAMCWLQAQPESAAAPIGIVGHSVGAGAALLVAARNNEVAAVVSLAAFAHPAVMMRRWMRAKHIPFWPLGAYILFYVQRVIGYRFDEIAPVNTIFRVKIPVLLVHGRDDDTVPVSEAEAIFARRSHERVELLVIPGSHDDYGDIGLQVGALSNFLDRALKTS
ncbi:MAG: alpha/beta fold hydrolase [Rhodocyclaceae bacterium]|nr:alpha/beta fold hydrolase [Rhodocyclaceae bacterium]